VNSIYAIKQFKNIDIYYFINPIYP